VDPRRATGAETWAGPGVEEDPAQTRGLERSRQPRRGPASRISFGACPSIGSDRMPEQNKTASVLSEEREQAMQKKKPRRRKLRRAASAAEAQQTAAAAKEETRRG